MRAERKALCRRALVLLVAATVCITACQRPAQDAAPDYRAAEAVMDEIGAAAIRAHMGFLSASLLEGRATGTPGYDVAARYVAAQLEAAGAQPVGEGGTWFQPIPLRSAVVDAEQTSLELSFGDKFEALTPGVDYVAIQNLTRNVGTADAPVVFVRYGITAPESGHDDCAGVNVRGKLVAYMFGAPSHFPATQRAHYSDPGVKAENAIAHGAVGILVFLTPEDAKLYPWEWLVPQMQAPRMAWIRPDGSPHDGADMDVVAALSESGARKLFSRAARPLDAVFADNAASSFELAARVRARIVTRYEDVGSANVVGLVPGSDPALRDEYVVYSAHLDHLGLCPPADGDPVCHGAFDNASGVAVLLELARAYARMKPAPRRSVVFLFVTGEEQAAFAGSDYFAEKPTVPREGIVANINVDGAIGIFGDTKDIVARGAEHSTLDVNVRAAAGRIGYAINPDPTPEEVLFIRSEQYSFVRRGIPALYVTEGSQAADPGVDQLARAREWLATRYHTPLDNMAQPTDYEAIVKGARFLLLLGYDVAQRDARPEWNSGDFFGEMYGKQR